MPTKTSSVYRYAVFLFLFFAYLVIFVFVGFWLHAQIGRWTLGIAFVSYSLIWLIAGRFGKPTTNEIVRELIVFMLVTPVIVLGGSSLIGRTFDTSYDGLFEHETAILALADNWNPVLSPNIPFNNPRPAGSPYIEGSPKAIWSIDASIYKLTGSIDGATFINLLLTLVALVFVYEALLALGIKPRSACIFAICTAATPLFVDQIVSFREDSISYSCLLIALASLALVSKQVRVRLYTICYLGALLLMAGAKFSNFYTLAALIGVSAYLWLRRGIRFDRGIFLFGAGALLAGCLVLFNPLLTNTRHFHSVIYPYNQPVYAASFRQTGVPVNIRQASRPELFFYGIFASSEVGNGNDQTAYAKLKVPFTFTRNELTLDSLDTAKLVGGYGVLFGGVIIISILSYLYLATTSIKRRQARKLVWLHVGVALIAITCLLEPIPNYARYNGQLYLLPILVVIGLALANDTRVKIRAALAGILLLGLVSNVCLSAVPASYQQVESFESINRELSVLHDTHKTYVAYSSAYYSSYVIMRKHNIPIVISNKPLRCSDELDLYFPPSSSDTQLCPIQ